MSLTGSGFDSSLSGGSFLGKKNSSNWRKSDFHSGSSNNSCARSRCNCGSFGEAFGFISTDPMMADGLKFRPRGTTGPKLLRPLLTQMSGARAKLLGFGPRFHENHSFSPPPANRAPQVSALPKLYLYLLTF